MTALCGNVDPGTGLACTWPAGHPGLHSAPIPDDPGKAQHWGAIRVDEIQSQLESWKREAEEERG